MSLTCTHTRMHKLVCTHVHAYIHAYIFFRKYKAHTLECSHACSATVLFWRLGTRASFCTNTFFLLTNHQFKSGFSIYISLMRKWPPTLPVLSGLFADGFFIYLQKVVLINQVTTKVYPDKKTQIVPAMCMFCFLASSVLRLRVRVASMCLFNLVINRFI